MITPYVNRGIPLLALDDGNTEPPEQKQASQGNKVSPIESIVKLLIESEEFLKIFNANSKGVN